MNLIIAPYDDSFREDILALSLRAWAPVFAKLEPAVAPYVFDAFYPSGWQLRQSSDIKDFLENEAPNIWVALANRKPVGWIGIRLHIEDSMGEIYIIAVDPDAQRLGIARSLIEAAFEHMRAAQIKIVMVETGDDPGHAASRSAYESIGFERWPVARYFREL